MTNLAYSKRTELEKGFLWKTFSVYSAPPKFWYARRLVMRYLQVFLAFGGRLSFPNRALSPQRPTGSHKGIKITSLRY